MKKMLSVFLVLVLLVTNVQAISVLAQTDKHSFFILHDKQRESLINGATSEELTAVSSVPLMYGKGERYIVRFDKSVPEKDVYDCVSEYSFRLLANSKERMFLLYIDDIDVFTEKYIHLTEYVHKDEARTVNMAIAPNDPYIESAWEYDMMNIRQAWALSGDVSDITVAVIDSGIFREHEDLRDANILNGFDAVEQVEGVYYDDFGHGTKVAGIIAACADNGKGVAGIANGVRLLPICVVNMIGQVYSADLVSAIYFAADSGADIINMSVGGYDYVKAEQEAVTYAADKGCILVSSAGNEGNSIEYAGQKSYPASYDRVISVASVDASGVACVFSQYNDAVDIAAPGKDITSLSTAAPNAYSKSSGTSFSAPYISAIAALALSAVDDGVKLGTDEFEVLIRSTAKGESGERYGAGTVDAAEVLKNVNKPIICGVSDGEAYFGNRKITFNRGTGMLDGEPYTSGELCKVSGQHSLEVTDGENTVSVSFTTDNLPLKYNYKVNDSYAVFTFERGTAQIDGYPYASGEKITVQGKHTFVLTGPFGNTETKEFSLSLSSPDVIGVSDGETYTAPVALTVCGEGKVTLNGKTISGTYVISENGDYTLHSVSSDGKTQRETSFKVDISGTNEYNTVIAGTKIIVDEQNGYVAVYSDALTGLRIHKMSDLSKIYSFINYQKNILGYSFFGEYLILYHTESVSFVNRATLTGSGTAEKEIKLDAQAVAFCRYGDNIYFAAKREGGSTVSVIDLKTDSVTRIAHLGASVDTVAFDTVTDTLFLSDSTASDGTVYTVNTEQKTVALIQTDCKFKNGGLLCANGMLAIGGNVYSTDTKEPLYSFGDTSKALYFDAETLITQSAIYSLDGGRRIGILPCTAEQIVFSDKTYTVHSGNVLRVTENEYFAATEFRITSNSEPLEYDAFTEMKSSVGEINAIAYGKNNVYVTLKDTPALFILDGQTMNCKETVSLRFIPEEIRYHEGTVYVSFANSKTVCRYNAATAKSEYAVFETDGAITHFEPYGDCLVILSDGKIKIYDRNGGTPIYSFSQAKIEAFTLNEQSNRMYIGFSSSIFKVVQCIDLASYRTVSSSAVDYYLDGMWCDSEYLYINTVTYDGKSLKILSGAYGRILARSGDILITADGLYNIRESASLSRYVIDCDGFASDGKGGGFYFKDDTLFRISNSDTTLNTAPVVMGLENGSEYYAGTTVNFNTGAGFIDGVRTENFFSVKDGGKHSFVLVLPYGRKYTYDFSVFATLDSVAFKNSNIKLNVNEKATLEPEFFPKGAPAVELIYSVDSGVCAVNKNGVITALNAGTAVITAKSADGKYTATATVTVNPVSIAFKSSVYTVDREHSTVKNIPSGTSVAMFLADLKGNTAEYTVIKRTDGTTVQNGIIATGMCAELLNCDGETQDMLFLSVKGDCDGDGIITVGDLVTASKIKRTPEQYSYAQTAAVSFGNTDSVTDGDLLKLKTHLLGKSKISSYSAVPSGWNPATLSAEAKSELKNPRRITVTVRADGFSEITGASFMVNYDPTVFTVYAVIAKNTAWETSHYDDGNAITFVTYSNSESVASELVDIVFVIADGDTSQTHLYFSEMTVYGTAAYYCDNTDSVIYLSGEHSSEEESSSETAVSAELKNIGTDIGTLSPEFTPSQKSYILTVPSGTEKVVFNCIPEDENTSVTVKGSEMLSSTGATVYRIYCNNGATSSVYTVTVTFSASEPEESETSIGEQESGNSLAVVFAVVAVILFIGAAVMFILVKKYGFFRR